MKSGGQRVSIKIMKKSIASLLLLTVLFMNMGLGEPVHAGDLNSEGQGIEGNRQEVVENTQEVAEGTGDEAGNQEGSDAGEENDAESENGGVLEDEPNSDLGNGDVSEEEQGGEDEDDSDGDIATEEPTPIVEEIEEIQEIQPLVIKYQAHVQSIGWQPEKKNGQLAGTTGRSKRVEAIKINVIDAENKAIEGYGIEYQTHVQSIGWQDWVADGQMSGTMGLGKRTEALRVRLTGIAAEKYDVYYRVHIQSYGWLGWASNGAPAGSREYGKRIEAVELRLVAKGEEAPGAGGSSYKCPRVKYQAHAQSVGWQGNVYDDSVAGVTGRSKRLEALRISLPETEYEGGIEYRVHAQTIGWQSWKSNGQLAGTTGQGKRIEAIEVRLTGELAEYYDIYYSLHLAKIGWCNYAVNGETAGSSGLSKRVEAIKIKLVKKDETKPATNGTKYIQGYINTDFSYQGTIQGSGISKDTVQGSVLGTVNQSRRLENITLRLNQSGDNVPKGTIKYATHISGKGWSKWATQGNVSGCTDGTAGLEAVKIALSGDISNYYDIYYSTYVQKYGWLGWAKNGQAAGTTKCGYRMEALRIMLVSKDVAAPGANRNYYKEQKWMPGPIMNMALKANLYNSSTPYILMVDRGARKVGVFRGYAGTWDNVKYLDCSVGKPSTPTVGGVFKVGSRGYYFNSGSLRCFWWTQFYGDYLFHSVPCYPNGTIQDGRLGMALSHGCVRLQMSNAKWIYDNIPSGTTVVVYN